MLQSNSSDSSPYPLREGHAAHKHAWHSKRFGGVEEDVHLAGGITKIIHQSWKSSSLPERFEEWADTWRQMHPEWKYILWSDESNRQLVQEHFPHLLDIYDGFPEAIIRADTARILYMKQLGGCYADLDFESLRPLDPLVETLPVALAQMGRGGEGDTAAQIGHSIPNAFMCSVPQHPFWDFAITHIIEKAAHHAVARDETWDHVEQTAGPGMISSAVKAWKHATGQDIPVLPSEAIYPFDWTLLWRGNGEIVEACLTQRPTFNAERCKSFFPEAYAITYWTHTWENKTL